MPSTSTPKKSDKKNRKQARGSKNKRGNGSKSKKKSKKNKEVAPALTAKTADRHLLYQYSVQSPEEDVKFFARVYKSLRGKKARHFREDFCGTALLSATWVKRGKDCTAEGFDIDPDPVGWGLEHNFAGLGKDAQRATLHLKDVREPSTRKPDIRAAQNFSYFTFHDRNVMLEYLRSAYEDLADDGIFVMDIYGGPDAMHEMEEVREIEEGFTYVWDQVTYWPATGDYRAYIHFHFDDGTKLEKAFTYKWRLWFLTEIVDVLKDAGFQRVETYWEGTDEDGESGNGVYRRSKKGENCDAWVTYLVALK